MVNKNNFKQKINAVICDMAKAQGKYWFSYRDMIYSYDASSMEVAIEQELAGLDIQDNVLFCSIANIGKKLVLSPFYTKYIAVYDMETKQVDFWDWGDENSCSFYARIAVYKNKIFMLPRNEYKEILILDDMRNISSIHIENWHNKIEKREKTSEYIVQDRYLWVTAHYSNQVLKLDMEKEQYELVTIGDDSIGYTGIAIDGEYIWLAESNTGALVRYSTYDGETRKFYAPDDLDYNSKEKDYAHYQLFDFEKCIISIPALCDKMTVFDKETQKLSCVATDFFDAGLESGQNYKHGNYTTSNFGKKIDEKNLWVQRTCDGKIASINIEDFTYKTFDLELPEHTIANIDKRLYRLKNIRNVYQEGVMMSLGSFIYHLKDTDENVAKEHSNVGAEIWMKVK